MACTVAFAAALLTSVIASPQGAFHFTVTADIRWSHDRYLEVLEAMRKHLGGQGVFQVTAGDADSRVWDKRGLVDAVMGSDALWFPGVGNHETEDPVEMHWIREEYLQGHDGRQPLSLLTHEDGPSGSLETTYSWEWGDAHLVYLNEYWNGGTGPGSDVATDGNVVPELLEWLEANLRANTRPAVFVFGHEPAFPFHRHLTDSLNKYEANRDAFWDLLERAGVTAYFCGHTHVFSVYRHGRGNVLQVDVGNAGMDSAFLDRQTFLDVKVAPDTIRFDVWRNHDGPWDLEFSWSQVVPIVFKDGLESGDMARWAAGP